MNNEAPKEEDFPSPTEEIFAAAYLKTLNQYTAAQEAGFIGTDKKARTFATGMMKSRAVRKLIREGAAGRAEKLNLHGNAVLNELMLVGFADIGDAFDEDGNLLPLHEMPESIRRTIAGFEVHELFEGTGEDRSKVGVLKKVKFLDKQRGLELLGKHRKLFIDRVEVEAGDSLADALLAASKRAEKRDEAVE